MRNSKRLVKIITADLKAIEQGVSNYISENTVAQALAIERLKVCKVCPLFVDEPIAFLRVEDKQIPDLSNKMCDDCGCVLAYKLRQSIITCDKWQK